jgi:hypothetical protein
MQTRIFLDTGLSPYDHSSAYIISYGTFFLTSKRPIPILNWEKGGILTKFDSSGGRRSTANIREIKMQFRHAAAKAAMTIVLMAAPTTVQAQSCDMLSMQIQDAQSALRRAAKEGDFDSAKDYAGRAKSALDDAAMSAISCNCLLAYMELDAAALRVRDARDAHSPQEFVDSLNRAIRACNNALMMLGNCSRRLVPSDER